jgi:flagellar basal body rod protein FlgG
MAIHGIVNTARSLAFYLRAQEVAANNLANTSTDAFKVDRLTAWKLPDAEHAVPVQKTDLQQGAFRETSRPLDMALDGPGFFVVDTPQGERLTRGGSMHLDTAGRLVDQHGAPYLASGGPIVITGTDVHVSSDGTISVDGGLAGRLRIENADDPATLRKEGFGRFAATATLRPVPEGVTQVRQGSVEDSNADPLLGMVDLVAIQRAYAANLDALKTMDGVLATVVNQVGRVD